MSLKRFNFKEGKMSEFKIQKTKEMKIVVEDLANGEKMWGDSIEVVLQFAILEKLEEIRCGLIDVETAIED